VIAFCILLKGMLEMLMFKKFILNLFLVLALTHGLEIGLSPVRANFPRPLLASDNPAPRTPVELASVEASSPLPQMPV
jgi:hypothetical protein